MHFLSLPAPLIELSSLHRHFPDLRWALRFLSAFSPLPVSLHPPTSPRYCLLKLQPSTRLFVPHCPPAGLPRSIRHPTMRSFFFFSPTGLLVIAPYFLGFDFFPTATHFLFPPPQTNTDGVCTLANRAPSNPKTNPPHTCSDLELPFLVHLSPSSCPHEST